MTPRDVLLAASGTQFFRFDPALARLDPVEERGDSRPTCLAVDPVTPGRAWLGTSRRGVLRTDDAGATWHSAGLEGEYVTALAASPRRAELLWAGTEPSAIWRSDDAGSAWTRTEGLEHLPSAPEWSFPPRPETHHVRWIACRPDRDAHLWIAIEAGALVTSPDDGRTWRDRVDGGPRDTHELAVHPDLPEVPRVAAGDGWFESFDGGRSWASPEEGLDVRYLRSVAILPGRATSMLVSASSSPRTAYVAGRSDGRLYRRDGDGPWERVSHGWPDPPSTIAPLLAAGRTGAEVWAADERGLHHSDDGGRTWRQVAPFESPPAHLRGLLRAEVSATTTGAEPPSTSGRRRTDG